jgi:hypothetical protein
MTLSRVMSQVGSTGAGSVRLQVLGRLAGSALAVPVIRQTRSPEAQHHAAADDASELVPEDVRYSGSVGTAANGGPRPAGWLSSGATRRPRVLWPFCIQHAPPGGDSRMTETPNCSCRRAASRRSRGGESRGQVGLQVGQRLDADRQPQQSIGQPGGAARSLPSRRGSWTRCATRLSTPRIRPAKYFRFATRPDRRYTALR